MEKQSSIFQVITEVIFYLSIPYFVLFMCDLGTSLFNIDSTLSMQISMSAGIIAAAVLSFIILRRMIKS